MKTNADILKELQLLSPLIAGLNKINVFKVPQGYFDSISTTLLACLQEDDNIFISPVNKQSPGVPEGYFDQLANSILNKIKTTETDVNEIGNLSILYAVRDKNVFETPAGYFENLPLTIINKIKTTLPKEELRVISPLLYSIQSKAVFEVPGGYFTNLPESILKKILPQHAKITGMWNGSLFIKYAVAAMMTGIMALGLYKYIDKPVADVINGDTVTALDASIEKGKNMNDKQFNEGLENLTEADIVKYLEKNGDITDVAVLRNNLEEINLPSQEDYLLDEATLENYLKEIEKNTLDN